MDESELLALTCDYLPRIRETEEELEYGLIMTGGYGGVDSFNKNIVKKIITEKNNTLILENIMCDVYEYNDEILQEMALRHVLDSYRLNGAIIPDDLPSYSEIIQLAENETVAINEFYSYNGCSVEKAVTQYAYENGISLVVNEDTFEYTSLTEHLKILVDKPIIINSAQQLMFQDLYIKENEHEKETYRHDIYEEYFLRSGDSKISRELLVNSGEQILFYEG